MNWALPSNMRNPKRKRKKPKQSKANFSLVWHGKLQVGTCDNRVTPPFVKNEQATDKVKRKVKYDPNL